MAPDLTVEKAFGLLDLFGLHEPDELHLERIRTVIVPRADELVHGFYDHLRHVAESHHFLAEAGRAAALRRTLRAYLLSLGRFERAEPKSVAAYCANRVQVGHVHRRIGLEPRLYLGACSVLGGQLVAALLEAGAIDSLAALHKILQLDCYLAIDAYEQELHDELVESSALDELTGLPGRRALLDELRGEFARAERFGRPLTIAFLDVDRFKHLNDTLGHAFGDRVLREIATVLRTSIRPMDIAGRYGGDEFVLGIVEADEAAALPVARRVVQRLAARADAGVTVSIGLAARRAGDELDDLLARADAAMYAAKAQGRGRIAGGGVC